MEENRGISIWFFIGALLLAYGIIIAVANVFEVIHPGFGRETVLSNLHFGIWWGILLVMIGAFYFIGFLPWKKNAANL